jgi:hypothetical protein
MEPGAKSEAKQGEAGSGAVGGSGGSSSKVYHERQRLQFCLLHALNNLMQVAPISLLSTIIYHLGFFLMFYQRSVLITFFRMYI